MAHLHASFPGLSRFTVYGRARTAARYCSAQNLTMFRQAELDRVHFGMESGSADVLKMMNKGATPEDHIKGADKAAEAGLSTSFYIIAGLGGTALSQSHAFETASIINKAAPDFVRIRTIEIFDGTPLDAMRRNGEFVEADDDTVVGEIRTLVEAINVTVDLFRDSATNLLQINGRLPGDRERMLTKIENYLIMPPRQRFEYSLRTRF